MQMPTHIETEVSVWSISMQVPGVPELTCYREQGEPLPVINLNKDKQVALTSGFPSTLRSQKELLFVLIFFFL